MSGRAAIRRFSALTALEFSWQGLLERFQAGGAETDIVCNECGLVVRTVPTGEVQQMLLKMAMIDGVMASATCPHCGGLNTFPGFSTIMAYVCNECGEGVAVKESVS